MNLLEIPRAGREQQGVADLLGYDGYFAFEKALRGADGIGAQYLGDTLTFLVEEAADGGADLGGLSVLEAIHFGFALQCFRRIERFDDLLNEGHVMLGAADE